MITVEMKNDLYWIPLQRTGCALAIYRRELMSALPEDVLMKALERGKAIRRRRAYEKRRGLVC